MKSTVFTCFFLISTPFVVPVELVAAGLVLPEREGTFDLELRTKHEAAETSLKQDGGILPLNKMATLFIEVMPKKEDMGQVKGLKFDARMPAHNHGMVVKPLVSHVEGTVYKVEGVKLHMAGEWELKVTVIWEGKDGKTAESEVVAPYKV